MVLMVGLLCIGHSQAAKEGNGLKQRLLNLPRMFSFEAFKSMFHKNYKSKFEEVFREKLYLGNAFKAFISRVSFQHKKSASFLRINEMSDWTEDEWIHTLINADKYDSIAKDLGEPDETELLKKHPASQLKSDQEDPGTGGDILMDKKQLVDKLSEIVENSDKRPEYIDIAAELKKHEEEGPVEAKNKVEPQDMWSIVGKPISFIKDKLDQGFQAASQVKSGIDNIVVASFNNYHGYLPRPDLPNEVFADLRNTNCITPVRRQGQCGSCYIHATLALYEFAYCLQTGQRIELSEQYVIDCGQRIGMKGCGGGHELEVSDFIDDYGFETLDKYPSRLHEANCEYDEHRSPYEMGSLRVSAPELQLIDIGEVERQIKKGMPVIGTVITNPNFRFYGGGVDSMEGCNSRRVGLHAMLIVGSGREDGNEYWLFKNSYGLRWGEQGYYRLRKDSGCLYNFGFSYTLKVFAPPKSGLLGTKDREVDYRFEDNPLVQIGLQTVDDDEQEPDINSTPVYTL